MDQKKHSHAQEQPKEARLSRGSITDGTESALAQKAKAVFKPPSHPRVPLDHAAADV